MPATLKPPTTEIYPEIPDVLIVEDDPALRETLLETLQQQGFSTIAAADGAEALRQAHDRSPRLILLDLEMPVLNGWQVLERRRRDRKLREIPVVVMSALTGDWAGPGGADAQLEKPMDAERLVALVEHFLPGPAAHGRSILVIDDDDDTRASIAELLEDDGHRVTGATNGQEAEQKLREMDRPDCIIVDLWMPVMNGWSFINRLQRFGRRPIPILVVTAAELDRGDPVPLARVLRKPFHADRLLALVRELAAAPEESAAARSRVGP